MHKTSTVQALDFSNNAVLSEMQYCMSHLAIFILTSVTGQFIIRLIGLVVRAFLTPLVFVVFVLLIQ